jgi:hypothetical protein
MSFILSTQTRILLSAIVFLLVRDTAFTCELPAPVTRDIRLTNQRDRSVHPALAWTGNEYGIAWEDTRDGNAEIYFLLLDARGNPLVPARRITNSTAFSDVPTIAWTGTEFGITWMDDRDGNWEVYFARLDRMGNRISEDLRVTNDPGLSVRPRLVWSGSEYAIVWVDSRDGNQEVYFSRLNQEGLQVSAPVRVTNASDDSAFPDMVWNGSEYGVVWHDHRTGDWEIFFARLDTSGSRIANEVRLTNAFGGSLWPSIAWNGAGYGVAWTDSRGSEPNHIYFTELDANGSITVPDRNVSPTVFNVTTPKLLWLGSEYALVWEDGRNGSYSELYFHRLSAGGTAIADPIHLNSEAEVSFGASLVQAGPVLAIAWNGTPYPQTSENYEIRMVRIGCGYSDVDGDGVPVFDGCEETMECDNCVDERNSDQGDVDQDTEGDVCDLDDGVFFTDISSPENVMYQQEQGYTSFNIYRGAMSYFRSTGIYTQDPLLVSEAARFCGETGGVRYDPFVPSIGEAVYYLTSGVGVSGLESGLGADSNGTSRPNHNPCH